MALAIRTFSNASGPSAFFKAVGHPLVAGALHAFLTGLGTRGDVAVYDPHGHAADLFALHPVPWRPVEHLVQNLEDVGHTLFGLAARPVTDLPDLPVATVLVADYDAGRAVQAIRHLAGPGTRIVDLDSVRLPEGMLSRPGRYLDPLNFATNVALIRDGHGLHTRIATVNYWSGYGAAAPRLWLRLFDAEGRALATWEERLGPAGAALTLDSRTIRKRFRLPDVAGSLFIHAVGIAGHDTIKYALDVASEDGATLTTTHDANAFPADLYAGVPAPGADERVILWLQNAHPLPIPAGAIRLYRMGGEPSAVWDEPVPAFGTRALDVGALLPGVRWPAQVEVHAGRHIVRPRYEVVRGRTRIVAHANVERTDLRPDPRLPELAGVLGKGHILSLPLLPPATWRTEVLPTPMATRQRSLPVAALAYDADGTLVARASLGVLARDHATLLDTDALLAETGGLRSGFGHLELVYDFHAGDEADGWLHALARCTHRASGHAADTSFGSHVFNLPVVYRGEPQSYAGPAPGLSTRLYLRLPEAAEVEAMALLIYPASGLWHARSATELALVAADGSTVAREEAAIPRSGSLLLSPAERFGAAAMAQARGGSVIVRDATCRLFGYHALLGAGGRFSLDHMFGF